MQYRKDKYGNDISALGYGCMRFTKKGNSADLDKAEKEVMAAIEAGVNYFDTAYVYAGNGRNFTPESLQGENQPCHKASALSDQVDRWRGKNVSGGTAPPADRLH